MSTIQQDLDKIFDRANNLIASAMNGPVLGECMILLADAVEIGVYSQYTPHSCTGDEFYHRRKAAGGLKDPDQWLYILDSGSSDVHSISIIDDRHEVGVVESGEGYTWYYDNDTHIQAHPWPRPYFAIADELVAPDATIDDAIQTALDMV